MIFKRALAITLLTLISLSSFGDVSMYQGFFTAHVIGDDLNEDNSVIVFKYDNFVAGMMTNSYDEDGSFFGLEKTFNVSEKVQINVGGLLMFGYRRWQIPYISDNIDNCEEKIILPATTLSASYQIHKNFALQINNISLNVFNAGIRVDF